MQKMNDLVSKEAVLRLISDAQYKLNCDLSALVLDVAEMPSSSGWISTKDRLPEEGKDALVCYIKRNGEYKVDTSYRYDYNAWKWIGRVKVEYWQPLPEPPEKENNDE